LPPIGRAAGLPVSRKRLIQLETVEGAMAKTLAICRQVCPADAAATTRVRKSKE
jgi:hypothetical protein